MRKVEDTNLSFGIKLNDSEVTCKELLDDTEILKKTSEEFKIHTELKILDFSWFYF